MYLERLCLRNFRNYKECDITFHSPVTLIVGKNAMGKTNLLESLYFLCTGESHRANSTIELIRHTSEGFALTGYFRSDKSPGLPVRLDAVKPRQGAFRLKTDGVLQRKRSDWIGKFKVVVFSPESLEIVKGSPTFRRRWLDLLLSQLNREYLEELQRYRDILQHRNALLKRISIGKGPINEISVWDGLLLESGVALIGARHTALAKLSSVVENTHLSLTGGRERLLLHYTPGLDIASIELSDITYLSDSFGEALARARGDELRRGVTLVGPHRDDFTLDLETLNGNETHLHETARTYASQGQCRTIALALKLAELEFIREDTGVAPLFLLDDVLSELDVKRREYLLAYLQVVAAQTVITATDKDVMGDELTDVHLLIVEEGVIINDN
ncbi:MAG: DNA replication/repair protein RecF [Candidatus Poribacteria bacterium]|nr:DNA replication/repair protein RecF [Candidatus Poribacteria bacterium]